MACSLSGTIFIRAERRRGSSAHSSPAPTKLSMRAPRKAARRRHLQPWRGSSASARRSSSRSAFGRIRERSKQRASARRSFPSSRAICRVVQARAREYCERTGATLVPFGVDVEFAIEAIAKAAASLAVEPDEVWCSAGSGVLARGLARAWPAARRHVVQVGRTLSLDEVAGATIHEYPLPFGREARSKPPFPSDPHYDAKAWEQCAARKGPGRVLFWNVAGPARP